MLKLFGLPLKVWPSYTGVCKVQITSSSFKRKTHIIKKHTKKHFVEIWLAEVAYFLMTICMLGSINFLKGIFECVRFLKRFFDKSNKGVVQESALPPTLTVKGFNFPLTTKPRIACLLSNARFVYWYIAMLNAVGMFTCGSKQATVLNLS